MGQFNTVAGITWEDVKAKLESVGSKNYQYDSDLDAIVDLAAIPDTLTGKDADTVDGYHAGLSDGQVAVLPSATEGHVLRRGATAWEAGTAKYARAVTLVVAASDSKDTTNADYVCDGVNDQIEIQAAIDALPAQGGMVLLLEGTYNISATINIMSNNVTLAGVGWATKLFLVNGANCSVIVVGDGATALTGICIKDLQIDGNKANNTAGHGIYFYGGSGTEITLSVVINCYVHDCYNNGIYLYYADYNTVTGNHCNSNNREGIFLGYSNNNTVTGNQCNSNNYDGIYLSYSNNNTVTGNQCNSNNYDGIYLSSADYNTVTGNRCTGNGEYGVNVSNAACDANYIGKNYLTGNTTGSLNDAGTGTYLGVPDTTNNIDNVT